jgi:hypothetical protein
MKEIYNISLSGSEYAVGLEWEEIFLSKSTNINQEIKSIAKAKNKEYGCKITTDGKLQIGLARSNSKNLPVAACLISKALEDTLFVKKVNNVDYWVCLVQSDKLISNGKEGVFGREQLFELIDELSLLGRLNITCSDEDKKEIFAEDNINYEFNIISLEDIVADVRKTQDDIVNIIVKEGGLVKKALLAVAIAAVLGGGYYFLFTEDQLYTDIVNQELSAPLSAKEKQFQKIMKENQAAIADSLYNNSGKKMLKEKIETNIYSKHEIYQHMKDLYETYPLYFYEWEFDSIQFQKSEDNKDIKFSVVYKRINDSVGYYNEIKEKALELANSKFKLYNVTAYPGDLGNNIIIIDHYFKKPVEIKSGQSEAELIAKLDAEKKKAEKDIKAIKGRISETEYNVSENLGFISKKFGSAVQEAADSIEADVSKGVKIYDKLIKSYKNSGQEEIVIPESYYSGNKNEFLNLTQRNSFYQWRDEKKANFLPPAPADKKRLETFKPFVKIWGFTMNSEDYSTQGVESIRRAVDILDKTDISIYTLNYKVDNESWYIKGELYEKN